ncbi:MAG: tetratricopeptide repeat protein [Chitinophagaceae bacterium]|nr:tetratricopeptide repeat protein [Chitinophagaceae bacterium]
MYKLKCCWWMLWGWLLCSTCLLAQTAGLDSLKRLADKASSDSMRLAHLKVYAGRLCEYDSAKGVQLFETLIIDAEQRGYLLLAADMMLERGIIHYTRGNYFASIASDEATEKAYLKLPESPRRNWGLAAVQNNMGIAYSLFNDLPLAQEYYQRAIGQFEKLKDSSSLIVIWFNMAFLYIDIQDWQTAANFLQRSIAYYRADQPTVDHNAYIQSRARQSAMMFRLQRIPEGLRMLQQADATLARHYYPLAHIYCLNARGEYHAALGQWAQALQQHRLGYQLSQQYADPYYIADEAWAVGRAFSSLHQADSAKWYLQKALEVAKQYNYMPKVKFILKEIATDFARQGQYQQAWQTALQLANYSDTVVVRQNHNRLLLNEARYKSQLQGQRISALEKTTLEQSISIRKKSLLNYLLVAATAVLVVVSLLSYRNYKQKQLLQQQQIEQLETDKQLLAAEALMRGEEQERTRLAKDLHDGLGGMLSGVKFSFQHMRDNLVMTPDNQAAFERSLDMLNSSIHELRRVAHNMMPESLVKFGLDAALSDFCSSVHQSGALRVRYQSLHLKEASLSQQLAIAVYRIVQELISNILRHAGATQALVQVSLQNDVLQITVEDDGKGFDTTKISDSHGMGWSNIRSRVDYLQGKTDIRSNPGEGTSVFIELKPTWP